MRFLLNKVNKLINTTKLIHFINTNENFSLIGKCLQKHFHFIITIRYY